MAGQVGPHLARQDCAAKPRAFKHVGTAEDFGPGRQKAESLGGWSLKTEIGEVLQKRVRTAAFVKAWDGLAARVDNGLLRGNESGGVGEQEFAILPRVRKVEAGEMRVDAIVRRARRGAKLLVGAQAAAPNTRAKIWSIRFRW